MLALVELFLEEYVRKVLASVMFAAVMAAPIAAFAAAVDASLIPDGTYTVKVEKVSDAQHMMVLMPNGVETVLTANYGVDFNKVKPNSTLKLSVVKGHVPVYVQQ